MIKSILGSITRHAVGAAGVVITWLATADAAAVTDLLTNIQAIVGAIMTIGAAASGIWAVVKQKRAIKATALFNASNATGPFMATIVDAKGDFKEYAIPAKDVPKP